MELVKSHWVADEQRVHLSMPINKIDKENRLVSGFATLDNVDTSDDVVMAEASKAAFSTFRGNIREMHEPIAAGKLVDFKEEEFFYDGEFFRGIYATAYVSKGAQDTWEKVLDGTLSGFSIGGNITDQETKFVKDAGPNGKNIRFIKGYDLIELSLVDNPANQLANVFSIVKVAGGTMMKGMAVDTHLVNVFWCANDEIAKNSTSETETCLSCGNAMEQIGWFEKGDDEAVKTASAVADFLRLKEELNAVTKQTTTTTAHGEGGVIMADKKIEKNAEEDVVVSDDVVDEVTEEVVEDAAVEEVDADEDEVVDEAPAEPDFEKMFDDLKGSVKESIEKTVAAIEAKVGEATAAFDQKASEFEKSLGELSESLEAIRTEREGVTKRLDALEKASAFKKSGEVETEPVKKAQKGIWSGAFFDNE